MFPNPKYKSLTSCHFYKKENIFLEWSFCVSVYFMENFVFLYFIQIQNRKPLLVQRLRKNTPKNRESLLYNILWPGNIFIFSYFYIIQEGNLKKAGLSYQLKKNVFSVVKIITLKKMEVIDSCNISLLASVTVFCHSINRNLHNKGRK